MIDFAAVSEKFEDEFLKFDAIPERLRCHSRPDLCAFLMLCVILPGETHRDLVCSAEHDQIWLDVDCEELAKVISEEQFVNLMRCGVMYEDDTESLSLFV